MLRSIDEITGYTMAAEDGEVGELDDVLFDDLSWDVRYVVVSTGGWLSGQEVLISPERIGESNWESMEIPVALLCEEIERAPHVDSAPPVSRQATLEAAPVQPMPPLSEYSLMLAPARPAPAGEPPSPRSFASDPHLRSAREVIGYDVHNAHERLGSVVDVIADVGGNWRIESLIVDTGRFLFGKKAEISRTRLREISWSEGTVLADATRGEIDDAKEFDHTNPAGTRPAIVVVDYRGRPVEAKLEKPPADTR